MSIEKQISQIKYSLIMLDTTQKADFGGNMPTSVMFKRHL